MSRIIPVWKPSGVSSYDVVRACKRRLRELDIKKPKIGHAGTLDPFAEGVVLIMYGREATKRFDELQKLKKVYLAKSVLGASSTTLDLTGEIKSENKNLPNEKQVEDFFAQNKKFWIGKKSQKIPDFSASKVGGVPRYKLARVGQELPFKEKEVEIYGLELLSVLGSEVTWRASVGSGTYIRQLGLDLWKGLGFTSYLTTLVRESVGDFTKDKCVSYEEVGLLELGFFEFGAQS